MRSKYFYGILIGIGVGLVLTFLYLLRLFDSWQLSLSDTLFLPRAPTNDIVIIAIDDKSIQTVGRWPWDRSVHARLIDSIATNAKAVGVDIAFPEPSTPEHDGKLAQVLTKHNNIVLPIEANALELREGTVILNEYLRPIPKFQQAARSGLVNMSIDIDGITRLVPIGIRTNEGQSVENFSVEILSLYDGRLPKEIRERIPKVNGRMRINYVGKPESFQTYSYIDVLSGSIPKEAFSGKIVIVGSTALDLHDNLLTPVSGGKLMSGVEVHANVLQTILENKYLYEEPEFMTVGTIALVSIVFSVLFAVLGIVWGSILLFVGVVLYIIYAIFSFDAGYIRNIVFPPLAFIVVYIVQVIYKYFVENKKKRYIKRALSFYLSESVMREVLSDPKKLALGGVRKEMTVLFSDIAGFTSISEELPPDTLATLLNNYLTRMTNIVFTHMGVLDKYIGDAVMAFWGAPLDDPDHALQACRAAIAMQKDIEEIKKDWLEIGVENFDVRIGINTGEMTVGNMGSKLRFDYTLLGDNVNLGSRLEGLNKEYHTGIIISGSTFERVKHDVIARRLDTVAVKGKAKGVPVYELRAMGQASDKEKEFLEAFEHARKNYEEGKFKEALTQFERIVHEFSYDFTTKLYIQRCKEYIFHPPAHWDGIFYAESK